MKKPEIKETKGTFITQKLKSSYWGPFSGLKTQDLIKRSRILTGVIFCPRSFEAVRIYIWTLKKRLVNSKIFEKMNSRSNECFSIHLFVISGVTLLCSVSHDKVGKGNALMKESTS